MTLRFQPHLLFNSFPSLGKASERSWDTANPTWRLVLVYTRLPLPEPRHRSFTSLRQLRAVKPTNCSSCQRGNGIRKLRVNLFKPCTSILSNIHNLTTDHRQQDLLTTEKLFRYSEVVVLQHDDVGKFPFLQ
jgi:hypothetical protein